VSGMPSKRRYRSTLDFVERDFRACWRNAQTLSQLRRTLLITARCAAALKITNWLSLNLAVGLRFWA